MNMITRNINDMNNNVITIVANIKVMRDTKERGVQRLYQTTLLT